MHSEAKDRPAGTAGEAAAPGAPTEGGSGESGELRAEPRPEAPEAEAGDAVAGLRAALAEAEAKAAENWDRFLRARADLENYRQRVERDLAATVRRQKSGLLHRILEVADNLERALAAVRGTPGGGLDDERLAPVIEGFELISRQLQNALAAEGLEPIDAAGQPFDPALHEAVVVWESPEATAPTVTDVLQKGYRYGGEVLRPARVRVARPPEPAPAEAPETTH